MVIYLRETMADNDIGQASRTCWSAGWVGGRASPRLSYDRSESYIFLRIMAADVTVKTVLLTGAFYEPWLNSGQDPVRFCVANTASRLCGSNSSLNGRQFSAASLSKSGSIRYEYSATFFFIVFLLLRITFLLDSTAYRKSCFVHLRIITDH